MQKIKKRKGSYHKDYCIDCISELHIKEYKGGIVVFCPKCGFKAKLNGSS